MKRFLALLLVFSMLFALVACDRSNAQATIAGSSNQTISTEKPTDKIEATEGATETTQTPTEESSVPTGEPTTPPTEAPTTPPTEEPTVPPTEAPTTPPTEEPTAPPASEPAACSHSWKNATCTAPKTCAKCGVTEGTATGHNWKDATCTTPKTCANCNATEGTATGHNWEAATCTTPKTCKTCGATEGAVAAHSWKDATCTAPKTCKNCGATEGAVAAHSWKEATCTTPKTCKTCGATEGTAASHNWKNATCAAPKTCINCGKTEGTTVGHSWSDTVPKSCSGCGATIGTDYGYQDLAHNSHGKAMQALYHQIVTACEAFEKRTDNITPTDGKYLVTQITLDLSVLSLDEAVTVWKVFMLDNPKYYWLSNSITITGNVFDLCIDSIYADSAYRSKCDAALVDLVTACSAKLKSGMNQLEKAMAIHDFILGRMDYAYEADGVTPETEIWAHNLMGCAEKKSGVCESFAETYQYLCLINGLDCLIVTGIGGEEEHAWNLVKIDNQWYGVDCTFDDTSADPTPYNYFGINDYRLSVEYTIDSGIGIDYLYALPQVANQGIELVELYKDGQFIDIYVNIDGAFAAMTDRNGSYEVRLMNYYQQEDIFLYPTMVAHRIVIDKTPKVKDLTIRGVYIDFGDGYYDMPLLIVDSALVLQSNLSVSDLKIYSITGTGSLNLGDKKLTCLGYGNQFSIPITGNTSDSAPSELYNNVDYATEFYSPVQVHTFRQNERSDVRFANDTYIVKAIASSLRFDAFGKGSGSSVYIKEACLLESAYGFIIHVEGSDYPANMIIDKISASHGIVYIAKCFGQLEGYGTLTLGSCDTDITLALDGTIQHILTDPSGNEIDRWTETANPKDIVGPIATLNDRSIMDRLTITFTEWGDGGGIDRDHTAEYILNSSNQIVLKN